MQDRHDAARQEPLVTCVSLKQRPDAPGVVLYADPADSRLAVLAALTQADAVVPRSAPEDALVDAVIRVATGGRVLARQHHEAIRAAAQRLATDERLIARVLAGSAGPADIAHALAATPTDVGMGAGRVIAELRAVGGTSSCSGARPGHSHRGEDERPPRSRAPT